MFSHLTIASRAKTLVQQPPNISDAMANAAMISHRTLVFSSLIHAERTGKGEVSHDFTSRRPDAPVSRFWDDRRTTGRKTRAGLGSAVLRDAADEMPFPPSPLGQNTVEVAAIYFGHHAIVSPLISANSLWTRIFLPRRQMMSWLGLPKLDFPRDDEARYQTWQP